MECPAIVRYLLFGVQFISVRPLSWESCQCSLITLFHLTPQVGPSENCIRCNQINTTRQFSPFALSKHNYVLNLSTSITCTVSDLHSEGYITHINTTCCSLSLSSLVESLIGSLVSVAGSPRHNFYHSLSPLQSSRMQIGSDRAIENSITER